MFSVLCVCHAPGSLLGPQAAALSPPPHRHAPSMQNAAHRVVTLQMALAMLSLPKDLGVNPATGTHTCQLLPMHLSPW